MQHKNIFGREESHTMSRFSEACKMFLWLLLLETRFCCYMFKLWATLTSSVAEISCLRSLRSILKSPALHRFHWVRVSQHQSTSFKRIEEAALAGVQFSEHRKLSELVVNVTDAAAGQHFPTNREAQRKSKVICFSQLARMT